MQIVKPKRNEVAQSIITVLAMVGIQYIGVGIPEYYLVPLVIATLAGMFIKPLRYISVVLYMVCSIILADAWWSGVLQALGFLLVYGALELFLSDLGFEDVDEVDHKRESPSRRGGVTSYGKPGGGIGANDKFNSYNTEAGVKGEKQTAAMVNRDMKNIGYTVNLFNSLKFVTNSMKSKADVDHAIVVGKTCFLIDSKLYRDGNYTLQDQGTIVGIDSAGKQINYSNSMHSALGNYRKNMKHTGLKFPKAYIILHTRTPVKGVQKGNVFLGSWPAVRNDMVAELKRRESPGSETTKKAIKLMSNLLK